jgi:solute carrier family 13 (sodium-dependent dicarboxylate transporter), member 2/3/5
VISILLLFFWSTEKICHPFDSTTTTLIAVAIMLMPGIGVFSWKEAESRIPWGTLVLFAVGISLGTILLNTKAATWLATFFFHSIGLNVIPIVMIVAILTAFNILIHLGFASASSLSSTLIPVFIALMQGISRPDLNGPGMMIVQAFVISFGFLLPVNAPQNMVAYVTESFSTKDFLKSGIPLTIIGYLLILVLWYNILEMDWTVVMVEEGANVMLNSRSSARKVEANWPKPVGCCFIKRQY